MASSLEMKGSALWEAILVGVVQPKTHNANAQQNAKLWNVGLVLIETPHGPGTNWTSVLGLFFMTDRNLK